MSRLRDWLRFRGWRNAYWREDGIRASCPHVTPPWAVDDLFICPDCGATVVKWTTTHSSGSSNTTVLISGRGLHP